MKELSIRIFWIVVTVLVMGWVTYQSWYWFINYKSPIAGAVEAPVAYKAYDQEYITTDLEYLQPAQQVQMTNVPQSTAPNRYVQPMSVAVPFTGEVCDVQTIEAINKQVWAYQEMLNSKPSDSSMSEVALHLEELQNACK